MIGLFYWMVFTGKVLDPQVLASLVVKNGEVCLVDSRPWKMGPGCADFGEGAVGPFSDRRFHYLERLGAKSGFMYGWVCLSCSTAGKAEWRLRKMRDGRHFDLGNDTP